MATQYKYRNKIIGMLDDQSRLIAFKKEGTPEKSFRDGHVFRRFNSLGFEESILDDLKTKGVDKIIIIFKKADGTEELFDTLVADWSFGKVWKDDKFGIQRHIPLQKLREMTKSRRI